MLGNIHAWLQFFAPIAAIFAIYGAFVLLVKVNEKHWKEEEKERKRKDIAL